MPREIFSGDSHMKKEWFFDKFCGERLAVCAVDGKIVEAGVECETERDLVGNIYKGKVANVVPGMQAAFVSCGAGKNFYLPLSENVGDVFRYDGEGNPIQVSLKEGDEILVQMVKPARGSKGAKATTALSFVGKNLIYLPRTNFLGISRKVTDTAVRKNLLTAADKLRGEGEGFIVRTAAATAPLKHLKTEAEYLKRVAKQMFERAQSSPVGSVVYRDFELAVRVLRDSLGEDVTKIYVGDEELYQKLLPLVKIHSDLTEKKLVRYEGKRDMFVEFGFEKQIYELASPRAEISNGGYLVIDRTEAMTVIDVNTGKFVGDADHESTVTETNLAAAREIARQVKLRNIGGLIAVDFVDMTEEEHRLAVTEELERCLREDRSKCRVLPMNDMCVTTFTRKRTGNELLSFLLKPCPHCTREGFVLSDLYMAMRIRSGILDLFDRGYNAAIVELNRSLMEKILSERMFEKELKGDWKNKRIYMVPHSTYHEEKFTLRGDNAEVLTLPDDAQILY